MDSIFRSSVHTHTSFCDGKDTAEVMVKKAIELGFVSLGFSEHGPTSWEPVALKPEAEPIYREEIHRMQQLYGDQLEIILGLEHEYLGDPIHYEYDYVIESVHAIDVDGQLCYVDYDAEKMQTGIRQFFGGDPYAYAKAYFHTCCQAYEHATGQIAGHIDLLTKFNEGNRLFDESNPRYLKSAFEAAETAIRRGMALRRTERPELWQLENSLRTQTWVRHNGTRSPLRVIPKDPLGTEYNLDHRGWPKPRHEKKNLTSMLRRLLRKKP